MGLNCFYWRTRLLWSPLLNNQNSHGYGVWSLNFKNIFHRIKSWRILLSKRSDPSREPNNEHEHELFVHKMNVFREPFSPVGKIFGVSVCHDHATSNHTIWRLKIFEDHWVTHKTHSRSQSCDPFGQRRRSIRGAGQKDRSSGNKNAADHIPVMDCSCAVGNSGELKKQKLVDW